MLRAKMLPTAGTRWAMLQQLPTKPKLRFWDSPALSAAPYPTSAASSRSFCTVLQFREVLVVESLESK